MVGVEVGVIVIDGVLGGMRVGEVGEEIEEGVLGRCVELEGVGVVG